MQLSKPAFHLNMENLNNALHTPVSMKSRLFDSPYTESTGLIDTQVSSPMKRSPRTYETPPPRITTSTNANEFILSQVTSVDELYFETNESYLDFEYEIDQYFPIEQPPDGTPNKNVPDVFGFYKDNLSTQLYISHLPECKSNATFWRSWASKGSSNFANIRHRIYTKGISHSERANVWPILINAENVKNGYSGVCYNDLIGLGNHPVHGRQITLDLHRTFSNHYLFSSKDKIGQEKLSNILNAYAYLNETVGYCQGMGFLVGTLLMMNMKEEETFWNFVALMDCAELATYFEPSMSGVIEDTKKLNEALRLEDEELYNHLAMHSVDCTLFTSRWFLQLFTDLCDWRSILHIWDIIMLEKKEGILRVSLAILKTISGMS